MQEVEVRLSDWVFNAIRSNEVLTLNRQYFRIRKPLARRLYEIARKHCGWPGKAVKFGLDTLQRKCRSEEHTSELQSLMRNSSADLCMKKKNQTKSITTTLQSAL